MPIRIVLAEDNYLVREGERQLLAELDGIELVAVCEDYDSLIKAIDEQRPDVLLTDIRMPPTGTDEGLRAADHVRTVLPDSGVVVLSQYAEAEYALTLLDKGAAGRAYLLKERLSDAGQLENAIREVARGGSVIDSSVVEALVQARARSADSPVASLTPRELEVLGQVAQGKNNAAIAAALFLTERAVEKHINSIFSKLELSEDPAIHRRVKATLLYLANQGG
ncbi:MAG: response regulator transcription factor [Candidatus Dormibacteria bacterium]